MFGKRLAAMTLVAGLGLSLAGCYEPTAYGTGPYYGGVAPVGGVYYGGVALGGPVYTGGYYGGYGGYGRLRRLRRLRLPHRLL